MQNLSSINPAEPYVTKLAESTCEVMKSQFQLKQCDVKTHDGALHPEAPFAVGASIGILAPEFNGNLVMAFPSTTFLSLASTLFGEEFTEISDENVDLASEIVNIIFGHTKAKVHSETGQAIQPAIPVVLKAPDIRFKAAEGLTQNSLEFHCEHGDFWAFTCIRKT